MTISALCRIENYQLRELGLLVPFQILHIIYYIKCNDWSGKLFSDGTGKWVIYKKWGRFSIM